MQLQIPGAELQNGGRSRYAEKAGCEKQGGPLFFNIGNFVKKIVSRMKVAVLLSLLWQGGGVRYSSRI